MIKTKTSDVRFVAELYPRLKPDDEVVERYRLCISELPPIVLARNGILVDGYHRWQAHVRGDVEEIEAENLGDLSDVEIFNESIRRNATHGHQLSGKDKRALAGKIFNNVSHLSSAERIAHVSEILSVSHSTVERWTADQRQDERKQQQEKAWDLWLDCKSEREIGNELGVTQQSVNGWLNKFAADAGNLSPPESRQHFDVWSFQTSDKTAGNQSYFGACPPQILENLLWFYTEPKTSVVVDLFAGSGTTIDVSKDMGRRVWAADIRGNHYAPNLPIHQHDITTGWPKDAPKKADLIFLDPPYWKQAAGRYSKEPGELAEMSLDAFYDAWFRLVATCREHLTDTGRIAYIISPTEDKETGRVIDHATEMIPPESTVERRIIVPYSTQQATGQQVEWARERKTMLKLYRDLVIIQ